MDTQHINPIGISARGLAKRYGLENALTDLDLTVPAGTVLGLLGPNGAGKTTTVSILTTLLEPDAGTASIAGADLITNPSRVRERIGLSGQYAAVDENLTGFENLEMVGRLHHLGKGRARVRAVELLEHLSLADVGDRLTKTYSGGMRRRLDLACALVAEPPVLFLDEPTTGLDPHSRAELWDEVRGLAAQGHTVLLTTQYMEEADALCDDIVVIDHGREIAHGSSDELKDAIGGPRLEITVASDASLADALTALQGFSTDQPHVDGRSVTMSLPDKGPAFRAALERLDQAGVDLMEAGLRRPTLDDVFLTLTGQPAVPVSAEPTQEVA